MCGSIRSIRELHLCPQACIKFRSHWECAPQGNTISQNWSVEENSSAHYPCSTALDKTGVKVVAIGIDARFIGSARLC